MGRARGAGHTRVGGSAAGHGEVGTATSVLVSLETLLSRIATCLMRPADPEVTVAVVAVSLQRGAVQRAAPALERIRDDDVAAVVGPRCIVACAVVRRDRGPDAFRLRLAEALFGDLGEETLRARTAVSSADPRSGVGPEQLLRRALDGLEADRGPWQRQSPARRPAPSVPSASSASGGGGADKGQLSRLAIRGGGYLVMREGLGMVVRLGGVVLTVREIGPAGYGIYSGAAAFVAVVTCVAQMGVETYLIRQPGELDRRHFDVAFTVLLLTSLCATAGTLGLTFLLGAFLRPVGVLVPLRVLLLSVPLNVLWAPAQAAIERQFRYRAMGLLELGGDVALYGTAVPLAMLGAGPWSLVAGFLALQAWLLVGGYAVSGFRPRLSWSRPIVRELARHGFTFSLSQWAQRLRGLVNPLVVGSFAGAAGVGYVAFAQRLVDTVGFARRGTYRLGMVAMGQVPSDQRSRLRYAIEEGSVLQLVALAVPFAGFGLFARRLIPLLFGAAWVHAVPLYVLLSLASVLGSLRFIQTTFLFSRGRNLVVAASAALSTAVLAAVAAFAVHLWGINGYGVAALGSLVDLWLVDRAVRRVVRFSYRMVLPLIVATAPLLLLPLVRLPWSPLLAAPLVAASALGGFRAEIRRLYGVVRSAIRRPRMAASGGEGSGPAEVSAA